MDLDKQVRLYGIQAVYFTVFKKAIKEGLSDREAKKMACDKVSLRFGIRESVRNRMKDALRIDTPEVRRMFRQQNQELIELLKILDDES